MTDITSPGSAAPRSLPARLVGVLFAPRATYAEIAARPRWLGALVVFLLLAIVPTATFMSTDVGKQAWLDAAVRQQESMGRTLSDAQYQGLERIQQFAPYISGVSQLVFLPLATLIVSGIFLGIFNAIMGGDGTFKQVFATVAHANVIVGLSTLFTMPIAYARQALSGATNLAVFFPFLDDNSLAARFLGALDLFWIWWLVNLSIGLGVLYKKRTGPIATSLMVVYVIGALVYALVRTALAGA
ncbi:MAG TPA: YIP1 family protein [Vicinamibacterales bacterium]|jgi:hypothetical protein